MTDRPRVPDPLADPVPDPLADPVPDPLADPPPLPYRPNVGALLFNADRLVFVGRRADRPDAWQMPQGGIDDGEDPRAAVMRELAEEIGTANAEIVAEHPDLLTYELPPELLAVAFRGRFRGQRQRWFALRFLGSDADIRLDGHLPAEFTEWRWVKLADIPALAVVFKRPIYEELARYFAHLAAPP